MIQFEISIMSSRSEKTVYLITEICALKGENFKLSEREYSIDGLFAVDCTSQVTVTN